MQEFILFAYNFRSRAERVLWALNEFQFPYIIKRLDPFNGETSTPEFLKLNPLKKIPVLVHGDAIFTESLAIMEYLNDLSATIKLIPKQAVDRYRYNRAIFFCATEIEPYLWIADQNTRLKLRYSWPDGTADSSITRVRAVMPTVFDWLNECSYIAGEEFTLADIYYYQCLTWAKNWGLDLPIHVLEYLDKLAKRAAFPVGMANR